MPRLQLAASALLALTGLAAVLADDRALLWEMAIAALNLLSVLWHSRAAAPRSPLLSAALGAVLCGVALLIVATQIPALYLPYDKTAAILSAAAWLRIAGLLVIVAGWLGWAVARHLGKLRA